MLAPMAPALVLSMRTEPGSAISEVPMAPGLMAPPLARTDRSMRDVESAAPMVSAPIVIEAVLSPPVASKERLAADALVLANTPTVPVTTSLFEVRVRLPPTTLLTIAPATMPCAAWLLLLPVTVRSPPAARTVRAPRFTAPPVARVPVVLLVAVTVMLLPVRVPVAVMPQRLPVVRVFPVRVTAPSDEVISWLLVMAELLLETPVREMPLEPKTPPPLKVRPTPATAVAWVIVPPLVLSKVIVPGSGIAAVARGPAAVMAEPFDFTSRLMSLVEVAAATVRVPIVTAEAFEPVVASKRIELAAPFVLIAFAIVPVWVILLLETSERLEPFARLTLPTSTPRRAPAALALPVKLMLAPAPVTVRTSTVATVAAVVLVALSVMPVLALMVAPVTILMALPVVETEVTLTEPLVAVSVPAAAEPE